MALSLSDLKSTRNDNPPRVLIYGRQGLGKTTLASEFVRPVFIQTEEGTPAGVELQSFGHLTTYDQVIEAFIALVKGDHDHKTLVIDSIDKLEPLIWAKLCQRNNWATIETPGFGKGYVLADELWQEILRACAALRKKGMTIVLIGHSEVDRFDDPQTASYSTYHIRLHKRARALIEDEMDAILFLSQDATVKIEEVGFNQKRARGEGGTTTWIYTAGRPAFTAKNRYKMPERIMFVEGKGYESLKPYFPAQA